VFAPSHRTLDGLVVVVTGSVVEVATVEGGEVDGGEVEDGEVDGGTVDVGRVVVLVVWPPGRVVVVDDDVSVPAVNAGRGAHSRRDRRGRTMRRPNWSATVSRGRAFRRQRTL